MTEQQQQHEVSKKQESKTCFLIFSAVDFRLFDTNYLFTNRFVFSQIFISKTLNYNVWMFSNSPALIFFLGKYQIFVRSQISGLWSLSRFQELWRFCQNMERKKMKQLKVDVWVKMIFYICCKFQFLMNNTMMTNELLRKGEKNSSSLSPYPWHIGIYIGWQAV